MSEATEMFMSKHHVEVTLDENGRGSVTLDGRPLATTYVRVESEAAEHTTKVELGIIAEATIKADVSAGELKFRIDDVAIKSEPEAPLSSYPRLADTGVNIVSPEWATKLGEAADRLTDAAKRMRDETAKAVTASLGVKGPRGGNE